MGNAFMQSPFFDVGYRLVAAYCCFYSGRKFWNGLLERQITWFDHDVLDWIVDWAAGLPSSQTYHRDTAPIRYWMTVGGTIITTVFCFIAVLVGWWQPNG
jgi:uncharacterized membrane protein YphA (DoxX/SURF4 family)